MTRLVLLVAFGALAFIACTNTPAKPAVTSVAAETTAAARSAATPSPGATTGITTTPSPTTTAGVSGTPAPGATPKDTSYLIGSRYVTLKDGLSEVEAAPGSASKITTKYFGNDATGDLNGDGQLDVAFVLTQSPGGSGTFYFVVAALKTPAGYVGTPAVLLGDRIAPQSTSYKDGAVTVNYADRKPGEPMTAQPSVGVSKTFKVIDGKLVVQ